MNIVTSNASTKPALIQIVGILLDQDKYISRQVKG